MSPSLCRSSLRRAALLAAAVIALAVCILVDLKSRPIGLTRLVLWGGGLVVYSTLLSKAVGPTIDWRDREDRHGR